MKPPPARERMIDGGGDSSSPPPDSPSASFFIRAGVHMRARSTANLSLLGLAALASACRSAAPIVQTPPALESHPGVAELRSEHPRPQDFARAFPRVEQLRMSARATVEHSESLGKLTLDLLMLTDGGRLRMQGRQIGSAAPLFDLLVDGRLMHVLVQNDYFTGPIEDSGSPFGERFGVEPGDLIPIVSIGQRLSVGDFLVVAGETTATLIPSDDDSVGDHLVRVDVDRALGLPRNAEWVRGDVKWRVEYLGWGIFENAVEGRPSSLMPTRAVVEASRPPGPPPPRPWIQRLNPIRWIGAIFRDDGPERARIELTARSDMPAYLLDPQLPPGAYQLTVPGSARDRVMPLSELARALGIQ